MPTSIDVELLVIGAGPTGLGAAWRLDQLSAGASPSWVLVDAADHAGGLAGSAVDTEGFTWDLGGHVLYSHYGEFDRLLDELIGADWEEHERAGWIWTHGRFIPYPIQRNLRHLPPEVLLRCVDGLLDVHGQPSLACDNFDAWLASNFGAGLADVFFRPFNRKMWGRDPRELSSSWVHWQSGSRNSNVPLVDIRAVLRGIVLQSDDRGWDSETRFRYPAHGGTGAIWTSLADRLPRHRLHFGTRIVEIDAGHRRARTSDGTVINYGSMVSSMPLDALLTTITDLPEVTRRADDLDRASTHVVGIGFECERPAALDDRYWLYFPDLDIPFHRMTVLSNYARANVPSPDRQWSVLCEVNHEPTHRRDHESVRAACVMAVLSTFGLSSRSVASVWSRSLPRGYPVPTKRRDQVLSGVLPHLEAHDILSRGRFGGWRYEVSNQDHSFMQGVEAVDRLLTGEPERTYPHSYEIAGALREPELVR